MFGTKRIGQKAFQVEYKRITYEIKISYGAVHIKHLAFPPLRFTDLDTLNSKHKEILKSIK